MVMILISGQMWARLCSLHTPEFASGETSSTGLHRPTSMPCLTENFWEKMGPDIKKKITRKGENEGKDAVGDGGLTLLHRGMSSCKAFIFSLILSLRLCKERRTRH